MPVKGVIAYLLLTSCLLSQRQAAAQLFVRVVHPALNATAKATACAWGDFNNDGNLDLFLANSTDRLSIIFVGQGNGTFAISTLPDPWTQGGAWGDFNNDGHLDLVRTVSGIGGGLFIHSNNGNGTFTATRAASLSFAPMWVDYDLDGNLDLTAVDHSYGVDPGIYLFRREPNGRFGAICRGIFFPIFLSRRLPIGFLSIPAQILR
jgi:FG-GAP-like repeat